MSEQQRSTSKQTRNRQKRTGDRALGHRIRKAREKTGLSQLIAAQQLGRSEGWLIHVENGQADPSHGDLCSMAVLFKVSLGDLVLDQGSDRAATARQPDATSPFGAAMIPANAPPPPDSRLDELRRRLFLQAGLAAAVTGSIAGISTIDPELVADALGTPRRANRRVLEDLHLLTTEHGRLYWALAPSALWPTFYSHLAVTRRIHAGSPTHIRPLAAGIASQAAWLLGMLAHRLHRRLDSVMFLRLADELAAEAGDDSLRAHALIALRAAYSPVTGAGPQVDPLKALHLTDEAASVVDPSAAPLLRTWLHACRAEDHAVLAHTSEAEHDLDAAEHALSQASSDSIGFFGHWDPARLAGFRGSCAVLLGQPDTAIPVLQAVLTDTSSALVAPYTAVMTDLAAAYAQRGDAEHACSVLSTVLTAARRAGMPERAHRVTRVRKVHLSKWSTTPAVRQLDDHLRTFVEEM